MTWQLELAEELVQVFLVDAARELITLCPPSPTGGSGAAVAGGSSPEGRKRVRALLLRMEGVVVGARSCLPDFAPVAPKGAQIRSPWT